MPVSPALYPRNWARAIEAQVPQKLLRDQLNRVRFGRFAPLSDEAIYVRPRELKFNYIKPKQGLRITRGMSGAVLSGDWDLNRAAFGQGIKFQSCKAHFEDGIPWEHTPIFDRMKREISEGKAPDGCTSEAEICARYEKLDRLFEETAKRGRLLNRRELPDFFRREHGATLISVARDGTLLRHGGGQHRLAIAWVLDLPEMPAQLGAIHKDALHLMPQLRQSQLTQHAG